MVPRLRIWKCPMRGVALVNSGTAAATSGDDSILACVVPAPNHKLPFRRSMPRSSSTRLTSTR